MLGLLAEPLMLHGHISGDSIDFKEGKFTSCCEPLSTLSRIHRIGGKVNFGINLSYNLDTVDRVIQTGDDIFLK